MRIIVLKFGSSVLRNEDDLPTAVHEIYRWWRDGYHVVAVVSAFGDTTNELSRRAHSVCVGREVVGHRRSRFSGVVGSRAETRGIPGECV